MLNKFMLDIICKKIVSEASRFCKEFSCRAQPKVVCLTFSPFAACLFFSFEKRAIPASSSKRKILFLIILIMLIILINVKLIPFLSKCKKVQNVGSFALKDYFGKGLWNISYKVTKNFKSCIIKKKQTKNPQNQYISPDWVDLQSTFTSL